MAQLGQVFNARSVEPIGEMGALMPGWYQLIISKTEKKGTKSKDGEYIAVEYTVVGNEKFKNRKVFENLNLNNKNQAAVEIAQRTLSALCHATGQFEISDTQQLHNIPFWGKIAIESGGQGDNGQTYNDRNSIIGYKSVNEFDGNGAAPGYGAGGPAVGGAPNFNAGNPGNPANPAFNNGAAPVQQAQAPVQQQAPQQFTPPVQQQAPVQAQPEFQLTEKCQGSTEKDFIDAGWDREQMVAQGYAVWVQPAPVQQAPVQQQQFTPQAPVNTGAPAGQQPAWLNQQPQNGQQAPTQQLQQPAQANQTANPPWMNQQ